MKEVLDHQIDPMVRILADLAEDPIAAGIAGLEEVPEEVPSLVVVGLVGIAEEEVLEEDRNLVGRNLVVGKGRRRVVVLEVVCKT